MIRESNIFILAIFVSYGIKMGDGRNSGLEPIVEFETLPV